MLFECGLMQSQILKDSNMTLKIWLYRVNRKAKQLSFKHEYEQRYGREFWKLQFFHIEMGRLLHLCICFCDIDFKCGSCNRKHVTINFCLFCMNFDLFGLVCQWLCEWWPAYIDLQSLWSSSAPGDTRNISSLCLVRLLLGLFNFIFVLRLKS